MSESIIPLPLSCRTSDDDYPGVVAQLGTDWRLVVSMNANRFSLQKRDPSGEWSRADGTSYATLSKVAAKYGARVEGLAALCASLPDDPSAAAPEFTLRRHAQLDLLRANRGAPAKPWARRRPCPIDDLLDL